MSRGQFGTERRSWLDRRAQELLADNQDFQRLIQLPGVAAITALTTLAEAGDMRRFGHHRQFLKYCGLDLAKSQSGQSRGKESSRSVATNGSEWFFGWLAYVPFICVRTSSAESIAAT